MRAVIDTNVLISGLLWRGIPHRLLAHLADGSLSLFSSPALLAELVKVLKRPKFAKLLDSAGVDPEALVSDIRALAEVLDPPPLDPPVSRDPDDDAVRSGSGTREKAMSAVTSTAFGGNGLGGDHHVERRE